MELYVQPVDDRRSAFPHRASVAHHRGAALRRNHQPTSAYQQRTSYLLNRAVISGAEKGHALVSKTYRALAIVAVVAPLVSIGSLLLSSYITTLTISGVIPPSPPGGDRWIPAV